METDKIVAISAAIPVSARDELNRIAAKEDRTFSYVVRRIIEGHLSRRARTERSKKQRVSA
jgi:predicted DNA-binding protein